MRRIATLVAAAFAMLLHGCNSASTSTEVAGGSSEQGNALGAVRFVVVDREGNPVTSRAEIAPANWIPGQDTTERTKQLDLKAGELGIIDSVADSISLLIKGDEGWRLARLHRGGLDTLRLEPTIELDGTVRPGDTLRVPGSRLWALSDSAGRFRFDSLPIGTTELKVNNAGKLRLDSLYPATQVWLAPVPSPLGTTTAIADSVRLLPPEVFPSAGTYQAQVDVATWHPLREATFERALSPTGPWTSYVNGMQLNESTSLWLRARVPGGLASIPKQFTWTIVPAPKKDSLLVLVDAVPAGLLYAFVPDSVTRSGDTVHVHILFQSCPDLQGHGVRGWIHGDSLGLFRLPCTQSSQTRFRLALPDAGTVRLAHTLQPKGMLFPIAPKDSP